jgi:microcystin-dependent protein
MLCDGRAISRTTYPDLFTAIGTNYGAGDGSTTFNIPDLRGRFVLGTGAGIGLTNRALAASGGEETHQLTIGELASHTHIQNAHSHTYQAVNTGATAIYAAGAGPVGTINTGSTTAVNQNTGGDTAHNTMPPFLVITYIIKVSLTGGATAQAPLADATQNGLLRKVSGNADDYVGGDNQCHSGQTTKYYDYDEFMGSAAKFLSTGTSGASNSLANFIGTAYVGRPGILQLVAGGAASAWSRGFATPFALANGSIVFRATVNPVNAAAGAASQHIFGFGDTVNGVIVSTGWYIVFYAYRSGGPNWFYQVRSQAAVSSADTGVPAFGNIWSDLVISATATQVKFWINGTLIATITTNIPPNTKLLYPHLMMASSTDTAGYSLYADNCEIEIDTGIAGKFNRLPPGNLARFL